MSNPTPQPAEQPRIKVSQVGWRDETQKALAYELAALRYKGSSISDGLARDCIAESDYILANYTPKAVPAAGELREKIKDELWDILQAYKDPKQDRSTCEPWATNLENLFAAQAAAAQERATRKVDRFEVIDDTGRAYVKGSIYGTPVKIQLSYQDDDRTLKVFVQDARVVASAAHPKQQDGGEG